MATLRRDGGQNITFCLVEEVVEHIFTFLPIKNVIQTSLIAKRFEKSWLLARKLNFDREFALKHGPFDSVNIVNRVLSSHFGPEIKILTLHFNPDEYHFDGADDNESLMEIWIQKCCEKGIEGLDLDIFHAMWPYYLPSSFIEVETLKVLRLSNVILNLPPNPKGLSLLTTLVLKKVNIYDPEMVDTVFHHCTLLETFDLSNCWGIYYLRIPAWKLKCFKVLKVGVCTDVARIDIDAPTLRSLYYNGAVCHFQVSQRFLHLNEAMLNIVPPTGLMSPFYVERLVANLFHVDVFTTSSTLLEIINYLQ